MKRIAALAALLLTAAPTVLHAATFGLRDDRAAREIGETTELYIDGRLAASFRLDDRQPQVDLTVTIDDRKDPHGHQEHSYVLCGTITVRNAQGGTEIHEVNATGALHDPDGHRFEALGADDFTLFYLADPADPSAAESLPHRSSLCHAPIS
jgi:hypothetical protein